MHFLRTGSFFFNFQIKLLGLISSGTLTVVAKDTLDKKTIHSCGRVQGSYYNLS